MHYDAVIIGAGMSGLAAGIRLAHFDRRVCIVERHYAYGGLNSYYTLDGRAYDVGLHAVTNFAAPEDRHAPLNRVLRQLRISRDELDLRPQSFSEIRFPEHRLRYTNDLTVLVDQIAEVFPGEVDGFRRLLERVREQGYAASDGRGTSAREVLGSFLSSPTLIDMLMCPVMIYGSPRAHDLDFAQFAILFQSIFFEGLSKPRDGVRALIKALVRRFRACGGKLRMRCGVERIVAEHGRVAALELESGETLTADQVYSSAGYGETMRLCGASPQPPPERHARISFVESIFVLDCQPRELGFEQATVFFNHAETFTYAVPNGLIDLRSGIVCCPNNYEGLDGESEGTLRLSMQASYDRWARLDAAGYEAAKCECRGQALASIAGFAAGVQDHVIAADFFTPRTIERFTGHIQGAIYGAPDKHPEGRTHLENLFLCGTDQGLVGIIGAMLSGVMMANQHGFSAD